MAGVNVLQIFSFLAQELYISGKNAVHDAFRIAEVQQQGTGHAVYRTADRVTGEGIAVFLIHKNRACCCVSRNGKGFQHGIAEVKGLTLSQRECE